MTAPGRATVYLETYGCQMNVLDSELVRGQLVALGYRFVDRIEDAGVVLLNTCSVRDLSEQKVWSQLGRLGIRRREDHPDLVVGVLGCMAEREGTTVVKRMPHVDVVCGPSNLDRLPGLIDNAVRNRGAGPQLALAGHTSRRSATLEAATDGVETLDLSRAFTAETGAAQAYVRITRGCDKFCSFCVVPFTRGPEVHRTPEAIVEEVRRLVDAGVLEVTLIGQTVNHYAHRDGGRSTSFADLLFRVHEEVPSLPRLRFLTSYPRDFGDDALDVMASCPRICRYLHLPAQSGSDRLLGLMNRGYDVEQYLGLIARARARMPDVRFAGDMIAGFPTETEDDHQASLRLLEAVAYKTCFVFKYSPRPGTTAARRLTDDVPEEVKHRRNLELLDLQGRISRTNHRRQIGRVLEVLVESQSKLRRHDPPSATIQLGRPGAARDTQVGDVRLIGRTRGDEIVAFDGPATLVGRLTQVRAVDATHLTILASRDLDPARSSPAASLELQP